MRLFDLERFEDESGISGVGIVAQGVEFDDGTCVLRWLTEPRSTAVYAIERELDAIHGHGGKTKIQWRGRSNAFDRAKLDAYQDRCENVPFASVGGLDRRGSMFAPKYIDPIDREEYLRGYRAAAREMFGDDWESCVFGWAPAITIDPATALATEAGKEGNGS